MPMDAWDGDTEKLSAQDFLRAFHRDMKVSTSSADKAKAFKNYLVSGSEADIWYKGLTAGTKADMDKIDEEIEKQYPAQETVQPTPGEYGTMLMKCKLGMEELGTKVKVADREVWAHIAWASKMQRLAANAGVTATSTYIEQVRLELPKQIRTKIGKAFANWTAFIKAVRDVDAVELEVEMKEWRDEEDKRRQLVQMVERRSAMQASPTAGIRAQLTNTTIGAPAQGAGRWPVVNTGANPFRGASGGGQGNLFGQPVEGPDRAKLLAAIAGITHHPDTDTGRRAHADQQQQWYAAHGNAQMSINTPYPLRPGRAPVNSGECYRCGIVGHTNFRKACTAPQDQCIHPREGVWRRIAAQALREPAVAVRAVSYSAWDVDDYGRPFGGGGNDEGRFEEIEEQGKA
ncbi:hypothetical protein B0H19DRAFT_1025006 [Mycena capillaripes]|nr:hypothetical protein B0H19DRAFT_1028340 [Mycena capillaripes]KAJ6566149.1 hypothetical protein B0H19DRAFT_1025006 [Mycena capillaripes]